MRILHVYKTSLPQTMGGIEQVIHQLAKGLVKLGVDVDVLSLTSEQVQNTIEIDGYLLHRASLSFEIASTGFSVAAILRYQQLAKQADIIHYHFPWPFMDVMHFVVGINKPAVVTYHSDIIRQKYLLALYRPLKRKFLSSMTSIIATSPNYLATSNVLELFKEKVTVIPIGLEKTDYPQPEADRLAYWRERMGPKFFLFVGVLRYYKGLHILIEASQGIDYPIVILGAGPIEQILKNQAEALGLCNIHFLGYQPNEDKVALLTLSYAVIFPSHLRSEAFGVSLLEGAMYGKPLISSEIGTGTTFINFKNETGLVVPPSDPLALREAMTYLWEHPDLASEMGKRAEQRFWQYFTAEQMAWSHKNLYNGMVIIK
jgi:O-antigen biosynthesis rhamnosyltransferase